MRFDRDQSNRCPAARHSHRFCVRTLGTAAFLIALVPTAARADSDRPDLYYAAATGIGVATVSADVVLWGAGHGTTGTWNHWAWHFVPVLGPILGLRANGSLWDSCRGDWCGFNKTITYAYEGFFLTAQLTALSLTGVGIYKATRKKERSASTNAVSLLPQFAATPQGMFLQWGCSL